MFPNKDPMSPCFHQSQNWKIKLNSDYTKSILMACCYFILKNIHALYEYVVESHILERVKWRSYSCFKCLLQLRLENLIN